MAKITITTTLTWPDAMPEYALRELEPLAKLAEIDHASAVSFLQKLVEWVLVHDDIQMTVAERNRHH